MPLHDQLREARLAAGLTQRQLADRCGMGQPYVSALERGEHRPTTAILCRIADALGATIELTGRGPVLHARESEKR
jgi:putative transcriptional regulator